MSKPVFEDLFKWSGRRNRQSYLLFALWHIPLGLILGLFLFLADSVPLFLIPFILLSLILTYIWLAVIAQRFRDFGWSGWSIFWLFVPLANIIFCLMLYFRPSDTKNKFGPSPLKEA